MRIALVAEDYYPQLGGVPEHVHNLALEFRARGHSVTVVTSRMGEPHEDEDFVRRVGRSLIIYANGGVARITLGLGLQQRLEDLFRDNFDVVHVHGGLAPTFGVLAPLAARSAGIPVVATFHCWFDSSPACVVFRRPLQRLLDQHAARIAVSAPVVEAMSRYFDAEWDVIPNGVDLTHFHPTGRRPPGPGTFAPKLLFLHRLEPRNHLGTLLSAMPGILARFPAAQLAVAGDGPWRSYYERLAAPLGSAVRFLGRVTDRPAEYRSADLYLCPTTRGSFGITLLEAMACGAPMVVADSPGFRALVNGGIEAVRLAHDDPGAWAETVVDLLGDPARRQTMSAAGVVKAAGYGWPSVAEAVLGVYQRVVRQAARSKRHCARRLVLVRP
ncbi:MAG TPA: glycosyltransferase family 4 protein [Gemmatimonadales bacterium]|nr:glycosyltransferase family 4 protein [Gemmatimonadales bacterium]